MTINKSHLSNAIGLHPDYKNWARFLSEFCFLNYEYNGYKLYNATNCWYIVTPGGYIIESFGFWGRVCFNKLSGCNLQWAADGSLRPIIID